MSSRAQRGEVTDFCATRTIHTVLAITRRLVSLLQGS